MMWPRPCLTHPTLVRALTSPPGNKIKGEGQRKPHKRVPRQAKPQRAVRTGDQPPGHLCVLVAQSCPTLCAPRDCSPPGSCVHGILQERRLESVAISSSRGSTPPRNQIHVSCISVTGLCLLRWLTDPLPLCRLGRPIC